MMSSAENTQSRRPGSAQQRRARVSVTFSCDDQKVVFLSGLRSDPAAPPVSGGLVTNVSCDFVRPPEEAAGREEEVQLLTGGKEELLQAEETQ